MKSARAAIRPHRRLPVRPEPWPDEDWCGYLDRTSLMLACSTRELRQHLGLGPHGDTWVPSHRDHGIAMTNTTAARLAGVLDLDPAALIRMQLQAYDGRLLTLTTDDIRQLDPTPSPGAAEYVGRGLHRIGLVELRPRRRGCSVCLAEQPDRWLLSWRLLWTVACERHRLLIDRPDSPPAPAAPVAIQGQRALLALAMGGPMYGRSFEIIRDVAAAIELHYRADHASRGPCRPSPAQMAAYLPVALRWATGPASPRAQAPVHVRRWAALPDAISVAERNALTPDSPVRTLITRSAERRTPPRPSVRMRDVMPTCTLSLPPALMRRLPAAIPQMLPLDLYVGDLSDLLFPTPLRSGRIVAAHACAVLATGATPARAAALLGLPLRTRHFVAVWGRLLEHGRLEAGWDAVAAATAALARSGLDYRLRQELVAAPATTEVARSIAGPVPDRILRRWLHEYWAGEVPDLPSGRNANGREQRALNRLDAERGAVLRAALEQFAPRRAVS